VTGTNHFGRAVPSYALYYFPDLAVVREEGLMIRDRECPTCGSMQKFRQLDDAEKAAVREKNGARYFVNDLWRCTAVGCRTFFPAGRRHEHDLLPEKFGKEEAAQE
jgi:hypothetical protein